MSYTLRGRIETRLAAALLPFLVAAALSPILHKWWPLELAGLMLGIGLALDVTVYHRLLPYQPGWAALPLGLLELGLTMAAARLLEVNAPLYPALAFFAGAWLVLQVLAHAGLPLLRLSWPEDGGELGRAGPALAAAAPIALLAIVGTAWAVEPPTVHLAAGIHQGPLVLDHAQTVTGEPGTIVRGGIVITADDVTVRNVTVRGGENGIDVDDADSVELEDVVVEGARARRDPRPPQPGRDPRLHDPLAAGRLHAGDRHLVRLRPEAEPRRALHDRRRARGHRHALRPGDDPGQPRQQHRAARDHDDRDVDGHRSRTTRSTARSGSGSSAATTRTARSRTTPSRTSVPTARPGDHMRQGVAIQAHYGAEAELDGNDVARSPGGIAAYVDATIEHDE